MICLRGEGLSTDEDGNRHPVKLLLSYLLLNEDENASKDSHKTDPRAGGDREMLESFRSLQEDAV